MRRRTLSLSRWKGSAFGRTEASLGGTTKQTHRAISMTVTGGAQISAPFTRTPRIFMSHRNGEPEVMALLQGIKAQLTSSGFDVLIEFDRLGPGAAWQDEIYTWLGVCHAGVVVISPDSLTRTYRKQIVIMAPP
jgi:hypothetical protein